MLFEENGVLFWTSGCSLHCPVLTEHPQCPAHVWHSLEVYLAQSLKVKQELSTFRNSEEKNIPGRDTCR